ncbi:MAG: histidine kinase [Actinomycetota bacterium]|nr:histidine kinase [Actinomycetota bacterium]
MNVTRPARMTTAVTVVALAVTAAVATIPQLHFAYRNEALHLRLEAAEGLIALVVAYLIFGRFRQSRHLADLGLVFALGVFAVTNAVMPAVLDVLEPQTESPVLVWAPLTARTLGAIVFAASAWPVRRTVRRPDIALWGLVAALAVALAVIVSVTVTLAESLPVGVRTTAMLGDTVRPRIEGHPLLLGAQGLQLVLFAVAAARLTHRSALNGDGLLGWVGAGAALATVARVNYIIFPSLYTAYVLVGDVMRLGFYVFLLIGAAREVRSYWEARSDAAVLDERRRMARDLHDGLAQELVFVAAQSRVVARRGARAGELEAIARACERGVSAARRAIVALTRPLDETLDRTIREITEQMAARTGAEFEVVVPEVRVPSRVREDVVRIVGEAIHNAVGHGRASKVTIRAAAADALRLTVNDNGTGFDVSRPRDKWSFGLTSMKERAEGLGGTFEISSRIGEGTQVEVLLPLTQS